MTYGSVCSGIEAATVAWHPLGWVPAWFSEIDPFPCKVLSHYYSHVPNLGNMLHLNENKIYNEQPIDLLVGGTPCQSFSIAGLRKGLASDNGNLALEFCRILIAKQPKWFVWENVPGALNSFSNAADGERVDGTESADGRTFEETADFAQILTAFRECGYSCAYRVLDAQYFGVPQRRRRIFVVGYFGNDWRPPAAVLFEPGSMSGSHKKGRKTGKDVTGTIDARTKGGGFPGSDGDGHVVPVAFQSSQSGVRLSKTHATLDSNNGPRRHNGVLIPHIIGPLTSMHKGRQPGINEAATGHVICYPYNQITSPINRSNPELGDPAPTLGKKECSPLLIPQVRRLTPLECERLQGFPDNYTDIPGASNTSRYQAIGNSMAVPVMHWIGKRIDIVDKFLNK